MSLFFQTFVLADQSLYRKLNLVIGLSLDLGKIMGRPYVLFILPSDSLVIGTSDSWWNTRILAKENERHFLIAFLRRFARCFREPDISLISSLVFLMLANKWNQT